MSSPAQDGFYMPPEWAPHERCWMAWPCVAERWPCGLDAARNVHLDVARAISNFEKVTILAPPDEVAELGLYVSDDPIEILPMPLKDGWLRDTGPTFLTNGKGRLAAVNWQFNNWGHDDRLFTQDRDLAAQLIETLDIPGYDAPMVCEGGAIHTDGEGTLLCVETAIIDENRNPGRSRKDLEQILMSHTGTQKVIWLPRGYEQDQTGGHVDIIACFAKPGVVLLNWTDDEEDPNHAVYHECRAVLEAKKDAQGRKIEIITLPQPSPSYETDGGRLSLSYMNFYIANGGIIAPAFERPTDKEAAKVLESTFPERKVIQVPAYDLFRGGGGIHCITQQQPQGGG